MIFYLCGARDLFLVPKQCGEINHSTAAGGHEPSA